MIKVILTKEPNDFDTRVRQRGKAFLSSAPSLITNKIWRKHSYWTSAHDALYRHHKGICMYCASWTPRSSKEPSEGTSVDHFISRDRYYQGAYEWENLRLARKNLNNRKASHEDVVDPSIIEDEYFHLNFISNRITPNPELNENTFKLLSQTIVRLGLNSDPNYINERFNVFSSYATKELPLEIITERFPFVAYEIKRQNFDANFGHLFNNVLANKGTD